VHGLEAGRPARLLVLALLGATTLPACATLGERADSIAGDAMRLSARRSLSATNNTTVQSLKLGDGSTIRQFVGSDGRVYAVAWNTRAKPRLDQLLGTHFATYAEAGRRAMQQRAGVMHNAVVQQGDLVVESTAHLNAHVGRAYLRSLLPGGQAAADAIR
jgi:hypothetical protein